MTAHMPGTALARLLSNVLAFVPARSQCPYVRLVLHNGTVQATGSDGYTAGTDGLPGSGSGYVVVYMARKDAQELEKAARAAKKEDVILEARRDIASGQHHVRLTVGEEHHGPWLLTDPGEAEGLFRQVDELLRDLERQEPRPLDRIAFNPDLFSRFSKVRGERDHTMHVIPNDRTKPVLVRIGPTFRGAVMPIIPEAAEDPHPEEGLW